MGSLSSPTNAELLGMVKVYVPWGRSLKENSPVLLLTWAE